MTGSQKNDMVITKSLSLLNFRMKLEWKMKHKDRKKKFIIIYFLTKFDFALHSSLFHHDKDKG